MINVLATLDQHYLRHLTVMLSSLLRSSPEETFDVYVAHTQLREEHFDLLRRFLDPGRLRLISVRVLPEEILSAPISYRYPLEIYYRIFAAQFLPKNLDRILYLDPDLVVINPIRPLYEMDFGGNLLIASYNVGWSLQKFNELRLDMEEDAAYINSGVMVMNLERLRAEQSVPEVLEYIEKYRRRLMLPDQDVLSGLYGDRALTVPSLIYNLSDRYLTLYNLRPKNLSNPLGLDWVRQNAVVVHYYGKNKPWKENYHGILDVLYHEEAARIPGFASFALPPGPSVPFADPAVVGRALRSLREERGLTQTALAKLAGLGKTQYGAFERGVRNPSLASLFQIASALGLHPSGLVKRIEGALIEAHEKPGVESNKAE